MRKITKEIAAAFNAGKSKSVDNTSTDGEAIFLHGRKIVERRADGIYVSLGGYGYSRTTQERLKPFAYVSRAKGETYLDGDEWNGEWTKAERA